MKKLLLSLACGLIMTASAHAELPDMTKVWQSIGTGKSDKARSEVDELYSKYMSEREGQKWTQSHSEESSRDVEEWLHFYLIKLYIAQKDKNEAEVNLQMTNIRQLAYLEYMGKPLVD